MLQLKKRNFLFKVRITDETEPDRSVESFCSTMRSEKARILEQLEGVQAAAESSDDEFAGVLLGLGGSMQALGELRTYFSS